MRISAVIIRWLIRASAKGTGGRKKFRPDKESPGMDKGVEGRKKGYSVGWSPRGGLEVPTAAARWGCARKFFLLNFGKRVLA